MTQYVYFFGDGKAEGKGISKETLGGKGAGLAEMTAIGIPVPPGFTITTEACDAYFKGGNQWPGGLADEVEGNVRKIEASMGQGFGGGDKPLLVSVRSGAAISMPGMMDTILNLGLTDGTVEALAKATNNERMAFDSYRRLIEMFGGVVMGVDRKHFEHHMDAMKHRVGAKSDVELNAAHLRELANDYKGIYQKHVGKPFPQDAREQLRAAIEAVFRSWNNDRAKAYRAKNRVTGLKGTGVNVQAMVFGNWGDTSGTGVGFTRNPGNGEKVFMAEYLFNAQGEDVVAGTRTPVHLDDLKARQPEVYEQILQTFATLETHYKDMQDTEF
ncbi:MAG: PEP/pyruvate-binding domain-containing protein, partial [Planctomycetota bacterium]